MELRPWWGIWKWVQEAKLTQRGGCKRLSWRESGSAGAGGGAPVGSAGTGGGAQVGDQQAERMGIRKWRDRRRSSWGQEAELNMVGVGRRPSSVWGGAGGRAQASFRGCLVPNRPWTDVSPLPQCWGPLFYVIPKFSSGINFQSPQ